MMHQSLLDLRQSIIKMTETKVKDLNGLKERVEAMKSTINTIEEQKVILDGLRNSERMDITKVRTQMNEVKEKVKEYL